MNVRKTYVLAAAALLLLVAMVPAMAFANAGVHGNYVMDTEACAGCHRAHTAPSPIVWVDSSNTEKSALLLSTAQSIQEFCLVCHGTDGQGAETNVEGGQYNADINGLYGTNNAPLLGGAFGQQIIDPITGLPDRIDAWGNSIKSWHGAGSNGLGGWVIYGGGAQGTTDSANASGGVAFDANWGGPVTNALSCDTCHDVHGSSNYRILKDYVWGNKVGGYDDNSVDATNPNPTPYVVSCEPGYPLNGFRLHIDYVANGYVPNYTSAMYARPPANNYNKGMVGWCTGCHSQYAHDMTATAYSAGDISLWDGAMRYRHAMNVPMSNFKPVSRSLIVTSNPLPLLHDPVGEAGAVSNTAADWLDCLTCHNAHGTSAVMTGFANANLSNLNGSPAPNTGGDGVPPTNRPALLKMDNRGVCENCHNK